MLRSAQIEALLEVDDDERSCKLPSRSTSRRVQINLQRVLAEMSRAEEVTRSTGASWPLDLRWKLFAPDFCTAHAFRQARLLEEVLPHRVIVVPYLGGH